MSKEEIKPSRGKEILKKVGIGMGMIAVGLVFLSLAL